MTKWEIGQDLIQISDLITEIQDDLRRDGHEEVAARLKLIQAQVGDLFVAIIGEMPEGCAGFEKTRMGAVSACMHNWTNEKAMAPGRAVESLAKKTFNSVFGE